MPNPLNPICPICGHLTTSNGKLVSGSKQYRCRRHKPNYTYTDSNNVVGSLPLGEQPMTQSERNKKYRRKKKQK